MLATRMIVTSALMSGVKPIRIIAQSRIGSVLSVPVTRRVISVSSKERAKARIAAAPIAERRLGATTKRKVCQPLAPRS